MKNPTRRNHPAGAATNHSCSAARPAAAPADPPLCGPLAAAAWADAIVAFWKEAGARGELDADGPLDILDLAPGRGLPVWLMLQALAQRMEGLPAFGPRLRYLAAAPRRGLLSFLHNQPELHAWLAAGILVPVLWDPERGDPCLLLRAGRQAWRPVNPAAVLAQDRWRILPQRLLAVHYGALLEPDLALLARARPAGGESDAWRSAGRLPGGAAVAQAIRSYQAHCNSVPIPMPGGALGAIDRIAAVAGRGYLVLAAAPGFTTERDMRLCPVGDLVDAAAAHRPLPVNFHLLAQHYRNLGAATRELSLRSDLALQVALGALPEPAERVARIAGALAASGMAEAEGLADAMRIAAASGAPAQTLLALLARSVHDPQVFQAACQAMPALHTAIACRRESWSQALEQVWRHHLPEPGGPLLHRQLAPAAMRAGNWELARCALRRGMEAHGTHAVDLAHLAWIEMRTGRMALAEETARRALARDPDDRTAREVMARLEQRLAGWDGAWRTAILHPDLPLALEPLDDSHAPAFHHQYRDRQIGIMAGLPPLESEEEVRRWIVQHTAEPGRQAYAVMHGDFGFVGYACLTVTGDQAYFCFWIGADFQGMRLAAEAGRMLCRTAREHGVATIFTSAYDDNTRSIKSLERIGFQALALRALAPEHDRRFLCMRTGEHQDGDPAAELVAYYQRENLPITFALPAGQASIGQDGAGQGGTCLTCAQ